MKQWQYYAMLTATVILFSTISIVAYMVAIGWEKHQIKDHLVNIANMRLGAIQHEFKKSFGVLYSYQDFYQNSDTVTQSEHLTYVALVKKRHQELLTLDWLAIKTIPPVFDWLKKRPTTDLITQLKKQQDGFSVVEAFLPVTELKNGKTLKGYVRGVISVSVVLEAAIAISHPVGVGIDVNFFDYVTKNNKLIYHHPTRLGGEPMPKFLHHVVLQINGLSWHADFIPTDLFVGPKLTLMPIMILASGLLFMILLVGAIAKVTKQKLIAQRILKANLKSLEKLHQRALRQIGQKEAHIRLLLDSTDEGIYGVDLEGNCTFCNIAALNMFRYSVEEVASCNMHNLVHNTKLNGTNYPLKECQIHKAFRDKVNVHGADEVFWRKDGTSFWVEYSSRPIIENNQVTGAVVSFSDITKRKKIEQKLRDSERFSSRLVKFFPYPIYWKSHEFVFLGCNEHFAKLVKQDFPEDVVGKEDSDFLDPEMVVITRQEDKNVLAGKPLLNHESTVSFPDGRQLDFLKSKIPLLDGEGQTIGILGTVIDITKRRQLELELKKAKQIAENANQAKSTFLAVTSHELRTPMNIIIGMVDLVLKMELEVKQQQYLKNAKKACWSLLTILNGLLDIAKIENGKLELEQIAFNLWETTSEVVNMFSTQAKQKELELTLHMDESLPRCYLGDPVRFGQILRNLIGNALKFTERGSIIVTVESDKDALLFSIADTGIGVPENRQSSILDAFTQADESTTRKFGGTGLGTSIAKELVELMGGKLWFKSVEEEGTTFFFTLCLKVADKSDVCVDDILVQVASCNINRPLKTLVVDDRSENLELVEIHLNQQGHIGEFYQSGQAAVLAFQKAIQDEQPFDVILMDVQMPEMDGLEATRLIRQTKGGKEMLIIALTAGLTAGEKDACAKAGMDAVLGKPINFDQLFGLIAKYFPDKPDNILVSVDDQSVELTDTPMLEDIDVTVALRRFSNDLGFYQKSLKNFVERYTKELERLKTLICEKDAERAMRITHSLRGVAANLGANILANAAAELEIALKSDADLTDDLIDPVAQAFAIVKKSVTTLSSEPEQPKKDQQVTEINPVELQSVLSELEQVLKSQDPEKAETCLQKLQALELPSELMQALETSITRYDFKQAKVILSQIITITRNGGA